MDKMKKYIIEFSEDPHTIRLMKIKNGDKFPTTEFKAVRPYTEPDTEKIRKEAYEEGYAEGSKEDYDEAYLKGYNQGLSDAWEASRKVVALSTVDRRNVFGSEYMYSILEKHTASEAIEKIRQYELEKEEIQVGDEVDDGVANLIVLEINEDGTVKGFDDSGSIMHATPRKKTGRHFPEIAEVLQKMRKSQ